MDCNSSSLFYSFLWFLCFASYCLFFHFCFGVLLSAFQQISIFDGLDHAKLRRPFICFLLWLFSRSFFQDLFFKIFFSRQIYPGRSLKFGFSEKATKFKKNLRRTFDKSVVFSARNSVLVKKSTKIFQNKCGQVVLYKL